MIILGIQDKLFLIQWVANKFRHGIGKQKYPIYHLVAYAKAVDNPTTVLTLDLLRSVSSDKREVDSKTILHLCGHLFCVEEDHLAVGTKVYNDEQAACHRLLQSAKNLYEYQMIQQYGCKHTPKCWTIIYGGVFADNVQWAAG